MNMRRNEVELRREQIEEFRQYLYERENARATIQKYISDIETFFNYLAGEAIVDKQKLLDYK